MELIVISDPEIVPNEAKIINRLFEAGLQRFHLRKPAWDIKRCVDLLTQIDTSYHHAIVCHQHHQLAKTFGMIYLHYTQHCRLNTHQSELSLMINDGYLLSTSAHDMVTVSALQYFEYTFLSPVFNSISKQGYQTTFPTDFYLETKKRRPKVIALGGVNDSNLGKVKEMNFDGAAVLGAIWCSPQQAISNFVRIKIATEQLNS